MIERILPEGVASAELVGDPPELIAFPGEEALIERAVAKRRTDFLGARHCARQALRELGERPAAILKGSNGEPLWPRGIVGSLAHCDGYRVAALAHAMRFRAIGIDAEPHGPLPDGVLEPVSLPAERAWLAQAPDELHYDRLLFCAKEATYKAWFPLTGRWLGFEDAHITISDDGTFHSELLVPGHTHEGPPLREFAGRWLIADGLVLAAVVVS